MEHSFWSVYGLDRRGVLLAELKSWLNRGASLGAGVMENPSLVALAQQGIS
jgi:hypothetical protein